jgi:hypothetical protein
MASSGPSAACAITWADRCHGRLTASWLSVLGTTGNTIVVTAAVSRGMKRRVFPATRKTESGRV